MCVSGMFKGGEVVCYMYSPGGNSRVAVLASIIAARAAAAAAVFIGMTERG